MTAITRVLVPLENFGQPVDYVAKSGQSIFIDNDTRKEVDVQLAEELLTNFPQLKRMDEGSVDKLKQPKMEIEEAKTTDKDFVCCSMCGKLFKNNTGRGIHMRKIHKVT